MAASTTPHRRSLARPRLSLGQATNDTISLPKSTPSYASTPRPRLPSTFFPSSNARSAATARKKPLDQVASLATSGGDTEHSYIFDSDANLPSSAMNNILTPTMSRTVTGDSVGNTELEIGDLVDVPGGMHGTVKFIGEVKGKKGIFAGVELSREWAPRGKNDGDVEGTRYFHCSIPGSGIFLPSSKAFRRASAKSPANPFSPPPTTPSLSSFNSGSRADVNQQSSTPSVSKFSQSVGPARAASPAFRARSRPSLPRPESPLRKAQNFSSTPAGRPSIGTHKFSKTGVNTPRYAPSPTPGKFGSSMRLGKESTLNDLGKRYGQVLRTDPKTPGRPASRSQSRLGPEPMFDEEPDTTPIGMAKTTRGVQSVVSRSRPISTQDEELQWLRLKLEERDKQLEEQTASLAEMEQSLAELQSSMPKHNSIGTSQGSRGSGIDDGDVAHLRALLREKNDKIAMLTADFDAHRADFRSTIDTLELASSETERVYEKRVEDLTLEIRELQDRDIDMESVAQQLKQLEELVQELEEGLEDARRGEAEARGEVEFLRGEVERGRSELRREREKASAALKGAGANIDGGMSPHGSSREVEQRDDEIRGLKAIIHSLSRDAASDSIQNRNSSRRVSKHRNSNVNQPDSQNGDQLAEERRARELLEREVKDLEGVIDRKTSREEELEHEIERLRIAAAGATSRDVPERPFLPQKRSSYRNSNNAEIYDKVNTYSNQTEDHGSQQQSPSPPLQSHGQAPQQASDNNFDSTTEVDTRSGASNESNLWCEICETSGHDILNCTNMFARNADGPPHASPHQQPHQQPQPPPPQAVLEHPLSESQRTGRDAVIEGLKVMNMSTPPAPKAVDQNEQSHSAVEDGSGADTALRTEKSPRVEAGGMVAGKASGVVDETKWCALCERDGHESVDCPVEEF